MATSSNTATEQIRPDMLTRLATHALRSGKTINELLQQMLDERETVRLPEVPPTVRTPEDWSRALRAWAASHAVTPGSVDDSRESIYAERGE